MQKENTFFHIHKHLLKAFLSIFFLHFLLEKVFFCYFSKANGNKNNKKKRKEKLLRKENRERKAVLRIAFINCNLFTLKDLSDN